MPKQKRWSMKRDLDAALNNIRSSQDKVIRVGEQFKGIHDDYYQPLLAIFGALEAVTEAIENMRDRI
jgi:hypothetical protein